MDDRRRLENFQRILDRQFTGGKELRLVVGGGERRHVRERGELLQSTSEIFVAG